MQALGNSGWPLTINQEALWRFQQQRPSASTYGMLGMACTRSRPCVPDMASAYRRLLQRHAILCGTIVDLPGEPSRYVPGVPGPESELLRVDGTAWDASMLGDFIEARFAQAHVMTGSTLFHAAMAMVPAGLARRVAGAARADGDDAIVGLLVFTAHHLVIDFLSFPLLLDDLEAFYRQDPAQHDRVHVADGQIAAWERQLLAGAPMTHQIVEYADLLKPLPGLLDFGTGSVESATPRTRERRFHFPEASRQAVVRFAAQAGVTPFVVMLTVFQIMLRMQTGSEDICVAIPTHGRARRKFANTIGYFANVVPLRQHVKSDASFRKLVLDNALTLRRALRLATVPFPALARQAGAHEVTHGRSVLAQVGFAWDAMPADRADAWIDLVHVEQRGTPFALCLTGYAGEACWEFGLKHDPEVVPDAVALQWIENLARMATELCVAAEVALDQLVLVRPPAWHVGAKVMPESLSIEATLCARAMTHPSWVALSQGTRQLTAVELEKLTRGMAIALLRRTRQGTRLGLLMERGIDGVLAMIAAFRAGVAYVPLSPGQADAWLAGACTKSGIALLACSNAQATRARQLGPEVWPVEAWIAEAGQAAIASPLPAVHPMHEAYVIHTSGSTGAPKGVGISRDNLERMLRATGFIYEGDAQHWTVLHHPAFDFAMWEIWGPLVHGHTLQVVDDRTVADPSALYGDIVRARVTHMGMTPGACRLLLPCLERFGVGALRTLCLGGESVDRPLAMGLARIGIDTLSFYGPTEATVWATSGRMREDTPDGFIGVPFQGMRAYVLDEQLQWVPEHRTGHLYLAGGQLAQYPGEPGLAAERFIPDPWHPGERMYRTGDRVRYTLATGLQFVGRDDRQVKIHGYRVELDGVATLLRADGIIDDVACAYVPARGLVAFYTTSTGNPLPANVLGELAARVLPAYVLPLRFVHRLHMQLNRNGKHDLTALLVSLASEAPALSASDDETRWLGRLLELLRNELGMSAAAPDTRFNDMGVHSIGLARLHGILVASVPTLQLTDLYTFPTPRSLAHRLAYGQTSTPRAGGILRPLRRRRGVHPGAAG